MRDSVHRLDNKTPLSEATVISLCDMALSKGIHYINMPDVQTGRTFLYSFLRLLLPYKNSACLTFNTILLEPPATHLHALMVQNGYVDTKHDLYNMEDFFYDICHFDFIWIEKDSLYTRSKEALLFEKTLIKHQLEIKIPVFILQYAR